jgi:hypothetical protein
MAASAGRLRLPNAGGLSGDVPALNTEERMRYPVSLCVLPAAAILAACNRSVINTIPPLVTPAAEVQRLDLELPPDLEIRTIDFAATTYADVRGNSDTGTWSEVAGRAFIKVWAVHRDSGEHYLLLYEDIAHRRRPVQIIRFVRGSERARPDSAR